LQVLDHLLVARSGINSLLAPIGEGMGGAGYQCQAIFTGQPDHLSPQFVNILACLVDVAADAGTDLDDRRMHLCFDPLLQSQLTLRK
jgi:hypothetical protein